MANLIDTDALKMGHSTLRVQKWQMDQPADLRISGNMSDVRMAPHGLKPPKTQAWSHALFPPSIDDNSDNASDNSDKLDNFCQSNPSSSNGGSKGRKRKMGLNDGTNNGGAPSFMNSGPMNTRTQNQNDPSQKDNNDTRNSIGQAVGLWNDSELAADFDGSLSGLGADLSASSYDMTDALLTLPTIYHQQRAAVAAAAAAANQQNQNGSVSSGGYIKSESATGVGTIGNSHAHGGPAISSTGDFPFEGHQQQHNTCEHNNNPGTGMSAPPEAMHLDCERRFQYVLAAATSVATKVNEETLTYLNQCQPYEIKLKKLGDLTAYRGVTFRSVIRLCFHDRRLQFSEKEQLQMWLEAHPKDRILQVDTPLSYGATLAEKEEEMPPNMIHFFWEPLKEVGVYMKINCISTEFTPKKHGGEKGVPFRLLIETYSHPANVRIHASACQVKVFKLKGADRKHKQDREKIMKKTPGEQSKLQPSYDCTVLTDVSLESLEPPIPLVTATDHGNPFGVLSPSHSTDHPADSPGNNSTNSGSHNGSPELRNFSAHFQPDSVRRWLQSNRFHAAKTLWEFSGLDLLRLKKDELIDICGMPEGIRLFNALHYKITFFVHLSNAKDSVESSPSPSGGITSSDGDTIFHPICLSAPSIAEMTAVIGSLFLNHCPTDCQTVERLLLSVQAPGSLSRLRVLLTEQLLSTLKDKTAFKAYKNGSEVYLEIIGDA